MTRRPSTVEKLARQLVLARRLAAESEATAKEIQEKLLPLLTGPQLFVDMGDGDMAQLTLVSPVRVTWVANAVKKVLPARLWSRVKVEGVDRTILEAMIASGELAGYDLSAAKEVANVRPYLKLTEKPRIAAITPITRKESA